MEQKVHKLQDSIVFALNKLEDMGKQVRKVMPWTAMVESHLVTGHVVHRMYRWSTCN